MLNGGTKVVVISRGMQLMPRTCPETLLLLKDNGVGRVRGKTRKAAELYNELAERDPRAASSTPPVEQVRVGTLPAHFPFAGAEFALYTRLGRRATGQSTFSA